MPDLDNWPGRSYREPTRGMASWSVRKPLSDWLRREGESSAGKRVLDVGCGVKPYFPFFAGAAEYVGVDVQENPSADLHGAIESLPVDDGSFDIVLCTQVLEHVEDPALAVRELHRVTAPGGRVLASTHGVMLYHPNPADHWRWMHTGLEKLFRGSDWSEVTVTPNAGTAAALGFLIANYVHLAFKQAHAAVLATPLIAAINAAAEALDRAVPRLRQPIEGALYANLHVVAVK